MGLEEWIVSIALVLLVVRQLRGRRVTAAGLLWPVGLVVWAALDYLRPVGSAPDLLLTGAFVAVGVSLGAACAGLSRLTPEPRGVVLRATWPAAALWTAGFGARLAFGVWVTHGGAEPLVRVSTDLHLRSPGTWSTALTAMALTEVCARTVVLLARVRHLRRGPVLEPLGG